MKFFTHEDCYYGHSRKTCKEITVNSPRYIVSAVYHRSMSKDVYHIVDTHTQQIMRSFWFDGTLFDLFTNEEQCIDLCVKMNDAWNRDLD